MKNKQTQKDKYESDLESLNPEHVENSNTKYESLSSEIIMLDKDISDLKLSREKNKNTISNTQLELKDIAEQITTYDENKEAIEGYQDLLKDRRRVNQVIKNDNTLLDACENE